MNKKQNTSVVNKRKKDGYLWNEGVGKLREKGPTGDVGVPETAEQDIVRAEAYAEQREDRRRNPSDLNDPGDPEAQDVGIPGGAGSGGEMSESDARDDEDDLRNNPESEQGTSVGAEENFDDDDDEKDEDTEDEEEEEAEQ